MRISLELRRIFASSLLLAACAADAAPDAKAADAQAIYTKLAIDYDVQPDGLFTETIHTEILAPSDAAAKAVAKAQIGYSESTEQVTITEAFTLKPDGSKLPVAIDAIVAQQPAGARLAPMFNDPRLKVIEFPNVANGDTVVWTVKRRQTKAPFPGQFMASAIFPRTVGYKDAQIAVRAPKSFPLSIETRSGVTSNKTEEGDKIVYRLHYAVPDALSDDPGAVSSFDRLPGFFISSFKSYDDLGHAFAALANDKIAVTPKVREIAAKIVANASDPQDQAKRIYEWTGKNIHYVPLPVGNGPMVPHDPDTIMENRYGDSKDEAVLLASLMKAQGIEAEIALINLGDSYALPETPTLAQLNHAIVWLPSLGLYVDPTVALAPFGVLPLEEYGKPVVHAASHGEIVRKTPILSADQASVTLKTEEQLSPDGAISGMSTTTATGPFSVSLRQAALSIEQMGASEAASALLKRLGVPGSGEFSIGQSPNSMATDYVVAGHFNLYSRPETVSASSIGIPAGLALLAQPGEVLIGPLYLPTLKASEPTPCFSGDITETISLTLPTDKKIARLPRGKQIDDEHFQYVSAWSASGQTVTVRRELKAKIDQPLCTGKLREAAAATLDQIRDDYATRIELSR